MAPLAFVFTLSSVTFGIIANIVPDLELLARIGAAAMAMVSGVFAARYYHIAYLEKKQNIKSK
jgi:cytochrome c biogenesis protein CcdA